MKMVRTLKNEVLMRSSHKLRFKRRKCIHSIEQPLISLDLKYFMIQMKLGYLKSILQSRSSLLPSYCTFSFNFFVKSLNLPSLKIFSVDFDNDPEGILRKEKHFQQTVFHADFKSAVKILI